MARRSEQMRPGIKEIEAARAAGGVAKAPSGGSVGHRPAVPPGEVSGMLAILSDRITL
jgi:hypothetical protein